MRRHTQKVLPYVHLLPMGFGVHRDDQESYVVSHGMIKFNLSLQ